MCLLLFSMQLQWMGIRVFKQEVKASLISILSFWFVKLIIQNDFENLTNLLKRSKLLVAIC